MKTNYLLPNKYKKLGWVLFILGVIFSIIIKFSSYNFINEPELLNIKVISFFDYGNPFKNDWALFRIIEKNIGVELTLITLIIGGLLIIFSKEKTEDEFTSKLRLDSMMWAFFVNFIILFFTVIFVFGINFIYVLSFNIFTPIIFFIIRFNFLKHKFRIDEE